MKIILTGATGAMGHILQTLAAENFAGCEIAACVSPDFTEPLAPHTYLSPSDVTEEADVIVDFSNHAGTKDLLAFACERKMPAVIATTGHTEEEKACIAEAAKVIPVFFSANMSVGIAVLCDLARRAAAAFPNADIEIIETHHHRKLDVPSGTALMLAKEIQAVREESRLVIGRHENGRRQPEDIGIHAVRLGNETGTHQILISTGSETLTLTHKAEDRRLFGEGGLTAAAWLIGKEPGLYGMKELLG